MLGTTVLAAGVIIGFLIPPLSALLNPMLPVAVFIFVCGTFLRADLSILKTTFLQPKIAVFFPLFAIAFMPITVGVILKFASIPQIIVSAVVLTLASPPSSGNAAMAKLFGYKGEAPLVIILVTMIAAPLTIPLVAAMVQVNVNAIDLMHGLVLLLFSTGALAFLLRASFGKALATHASEVDKVVLGALFVFAIATMDGVLWASAENTVFTIFLVLSAFALNIGMQCTGALMAGGSTEQRIAVALTFGNRNVGLPWAVLGGSLDPTILLFFALFQLPIFILPLLLKSVIRQRRDNL